MIERLPESVRTRAVARAVTSPSAILLAGGGTAAAILGGVPIIGAVVVGGLLWAGRVALAVPRGRRADRIDPFTLGEPWRSLVIDAQQARNRYRRAVERSRPGPLRDRLTGLGDRLDAAVSESWRIANQGDALESAYQQLRVDEVQEELVAAHRERRQAGDSPVVERTIKALEAQLASAQRIADVARGARDRLRVLNAQLDESVARAIELSVQASDSAALDPLAEDVETLVGDLEALRQGMEESGGASRAMGGR